MFELIGLEPRFFKPNPLLHVHRVTEVFLHMVYVGSGTASRHTLLPQVCLDAVFPEGHFWFQRYGSTSLPSVSRDVIWTFRASQRFSGRELSVHFRAVGAGAEDDLVHVLLVTTG